MEVHNNFDFFCSEKYVGKREGVMEEMEIIAAGLQTVLLEIIFVTSMT